MAGATPAGTAGARRNRRGWCYYPRHMDRDRVSAYATAAGWIVTLLLGWLAGAVMNYSSTMLFVVTVAVVVIGGFWLVEMWRLSRHRLRGPRIGRGLERLDRGQTAGRETWRERLRVTQEMDPHIIVSSNSTIVDVGSQLQRVSGRVVDGRTALIRHPHSRNVFFPNEPLQPGDYFWVEVEGYGDVRITDVCPNPASGWKAPPSPRGVER